MNSTLALPTCDCFGLSQEEKIERFFDILYGQVLKSFQGKIELRAIAQEQKTVQEFHSQLQEFLKRSLDLAHQGYNAYFGVNPRDGLGGSKKNIPWFTSFHCDLDYGATGHKKESRYSSREEAFEAIQKCKVLPTAIINSGGGYHLYWVLNGPVAVSKIGIERLEAVNERLRQWLGGDKGTQDISRILRVPGTLNQKHSPPSQVEIVELNENRYELSELEDLLKAIAPQEEIVKPTVSQVWVEPIQSEHYINQSFFLDSLLVSEKVKNLIQLGRNQDYSSRSEADQAVITSLVKNGYTETTIQRIFNEYPIGEKYREHTDSLAYLRNCIENAKKYLHLNDEEILNPLFINGVITHQGNKLKLKVDLFERYVMEKHHLFYHQEEKCFYQYHNNYYNEFDSDKINRLCQQELGLNYRYLFTQSDFKSFLHYASGDVCNVDSDFARSKRYLNLQNGLFNLDTLQLESHTPAIFTTHQLPYAYDPKANCPLFMKTLQEIFNRDQDRIDFLQQIVGYAFHQEIKIHSLFFFKGKGNNGKSLLLHLIERLFGPENCCTVLMQQMQDPSFSYQLKGKMLNIVFEETCKKLNFTDKIKAIASGEYVHGKQVYCNPFRFKPFAKHFIALNRFPIIEDQSQGMWRRVYILDFPRFFQPHEEDKDLFNKLLPELMGIFNWAIEGYVKLKSNRFQLLEYSFLIRNKKQVQMESNAVLEFLEQNYCTGDSEAAILFQSIYSQFNTYCQLEQIPLFRKKEFKSKLMEMGFRVEKSTRNNNQMMVFGLVSLSQ